VPTYALIVTLVSLTAAMSTIALRRTDYIAPAIALLIASGLARFAEWGFPDHQMIVMINGLLLCLIICTNNLTTIAKAIATLFALRIFIFAGTQITLYNTAMAWELSNALVLLQASILIVGANRGMANYIFMGWGTRCNYLRGRLANVVSGREVDRSTD